jgi:hypothetical protein
VGVAGVAGVGLTLGEVGLSELQPATVIATPLKIARADFTVKSRRLIVSSHLLAKSSIVRTPFIQRGQKS